MQTDALADRIFDALLGTIDVFSVHLGDQFGAYRHLAQQGPRTADELAAACGLAPRYAREWLEQQVVSGLLEVDDPARAPEERRFSLPEAHVPVLADGDSLSSMAPFARMLMGALAQLPALTEAYRTGGGVGWEEFGATVRTAQADANRPLFLQLLGSQWLPALPDVDRALRAGGRVADLGCGDGWSSVGIALAYPEARVDGFDPDQASIDAARKHAASYGLTERVAFTAADAATVPVEGGYDLVTAFECVHDLADPVSVLAAARRMVRPGGTVLVMDERVPEAFTGPGDDVERLMYGYSLMVCLPDTLSHPGSVGTGTVMRPDTLRGYARAAGFGDVEVLPIEHDFFRFYRLVP